MCKKLFFSIIYLLISSFPSTAVERNEINDYRDILIELGAFPYREERGSNYYLDRPVIRIDVNGWVPPYYFNTIKFSNEEKSKYSLSTTKEKWINWYHKYESLLNLHLYNRNRDPELFAIMTFLLDIGNREKLRVTNKKNLIQIVKAGIGLEKKACALISDILTHKEAIDIYKAICPLSLKNYSLVDLLFCVPKKDETEYLRFLNNSIKNANLSLYSRWYFHFLLYKMDVKKYQERFIQFFSENVLKEKSGIKRSNMYHNTIMLNDLEILKRMSVFLSSDPDTGCRKIILKRLCKIRYVDNEIINVIYSISQGKGKRHRSDAFLDDPTFWQWELMSYLKCVKDSASLDVKLREKLIKTLDALGKVEFRYSESKKYFDFFNIDIKE